MAQENIQIVEAAEKVADLPLDKKLYSMNLSPETAKKFKELKSKRDNYYEAFSEQIAGDVERGIGQKKIEDRHINYAAKIIELSDEINVLKHPDAERPIESLNKRALRLINIMIEGCKKNSKKIYDNEEEKQTEPNTEVIEIPAIEVPPVPSTEVISLPQQPSDVGAAKVEEKPDSNSESRIEIGNPEINRSEIAEAVSTKLDFSSNPATISIVTEPTKGVNNNGDKDNVINGKLVNYVKEMEANKKYSPMSDEEIAKSQEKLAEAKEISDKAQQLREAEEQNKAEVAVINETKGYTEQVSEEPLRDNPIIVPTRPEREEEFIPEYRTVVNTKTDESIEDDKTENKEEVTESAVVKENEKVEAKEPEAASKEENTEDSTEPVVIENNPEPKTMVISAESKNKLEEYKKKVDLAITKAKELKKQSDSIDQDLQRDREQNATVVAKEEAAKKASEDAQADKVLAEKELSDAYAKTLEALNALNEKAEKENQNKQKMRNDIISDTNSRLQNIESLNKKAESNRDAADKIRSQISELDDMLAKEDEPVAGVEYKK